VKTDAEALQFLRNNAYSRAVHYAWFALTRCGQAYRINQGGGLDIIQLGCLDRGGNIGWADRGFLAPPPIIVAPNVFVGTY
jgi:hypothetical protein